MRGRGKGGGVDVRIAPPSHYKIADETTAARTTQSHHCMVRPFLGGTNTSRTVAKTNHSHHFAFVVSSRNLTLVVIVILSAKQSDSR